MAEQNIIDLPKKITEQKNNDLIIFTTYTFDPIFFDAYILKKLKENNRKAAIIVLMDSLIDPKCTGICGALATSSPSGVNIAQEKSNLSLMFTE